MKYQRFEELPSWQAGMKLTDAVFRLTEDRAFNFKGDLRIQLRRKNVFIGKLKLIQRDQRV
ncbi:MAG TPA: hypothetical protein VL171_17305 [Verrucomicrobiae bacterium]|nr:hypothetical protein [Verrucomicrobiae bacterium]